MASRNAPSGGPATQAREKTVRSALMPIGARAGSSRSRTCRAYANDCGKSEPAIAKAVTERASSTQ
nr:hypothetical protein GCM10020092_000940 [Actinoplanes digitatis]